MRAWTLQIPPEGRIDVPALLPERFTWAALLFGLLWLVANRIWWAAGGFLGLLLLAGALFPPGAAFAVLLGLHLLLGFHAQDLKRAALTMRGWRTEGVVLAPDQEEAIARVLHARPELAAPWARAALA